MNRLILRFLLQGLLSLYPAPNSLIKILLRSFQTSLPRCKRPGIADRSRLWCMEKRLGYGGSGFFRTQEVTADELVIPARPHGWVDDGSYRRLHEHLWTNTDGTGRTGRPAYGGITNCNRLIFQIESGKCRFQQVRRDCLLKSGH